MKISYAQNYEDILLSRALADIENGFYIDIGAAWPDVHSVTKYFYNKGWRGINVEPNPKLFELLEQDRPFDLNICCAIADMNGTHDFTIFENTGLSTLSKTVSSLHVNKGWLPTTTTVECRTLTSIIDEKVSPNQDIHFLKIDVEGFESEVINSLDLKKYRPWILVVESVHPLSTIDSSDAWETTLLNNKYVMAYNDGINKFFVAHERQELTKHFLWGVNCLDCFIPYSEHCQKIKVEELIQQLDGIISECSALKESNKIILDENASLKKFYSRYSFLDKKFLNYIFSCGK